LNRPNDVVVKSDGCIYFTDPWGHPAGAQQWDLTFAGVYRVTPENIRVRAGAHIWL
jgi:sugar lactone lactonase YvrE